MCDMYDIVLTPTSFVLVESQYFAISFLVKYSAKPLYFRRTVWNSVSWLRLIFAVKWTYNWRCPGKATDTEHNFLEVQQDEYK